MVVEGEKMVQERQMNPRELDVLNILWSKEEPMMATDIVNHGKGLTQSTVTAVLRKLLHDKMVEVVGVTHSGKVLSRTYRPTPKSKTVLLEDIVGTYMRFDKVIPLDELQKALAKAVELKKKQEKQKKS